ncbi:chromatin assembly factor 1 subunit A-domain-containing protein [Delphinella strobiligena]|nr:chromatin assembly factor 1 subunit A-domain-containing protein [Delphinella strobiligena]
MAEAMELCLPSAQDCLSSAQDNRLKRPLPVEERSETLMSTAHSEEHSETLPTPPLTASPNHDAANRGPSPAPSTSSLSSVATSTQQDGPSGSSVPPPPKRRKLTVAEKERQRVEKEQKQREREEQKLKKDEEKRVKEEEKRRKREEREVKDREKELEKQRREQKKKDEEQKKKDDELKKERSQPKLMNFFAKPRIPAASPSTRSPVKDVVTRTKRESLSAEPDENPVLSATQETPKKSSISDYERKFLPFQLPSHTICAPNLSSLDTKNSRSGFDSLLERALNGDVSSEGPAPLSTFFTHLKGKSLGLWQPNAREVIESINGSSQQPLDLTVGSGETYRPEDLLRSVTIRHLHFAEDVRPPYCGSYTKLYSPRSSAKLRRNPFSRVRKDTDYDYDSEAEWEEPEEGEDLLSDGEDDEESIGAPDEMEDFLDEDDINPKGRLITGDLKPVSTGLCWDNEPLPDQEWSVDLESMKLEFFLDLPCPSINPFSTAYWPKEGAQARAPAAAAASASASAAPLLLHGKPGMHLENGKFVSPGTPLQPRLSANGIPILGTASGSKGPIMAESLGFNKATKQAAKFLDGEDLNEFREAVVGSNVAKTELLKELKRR